MHYSTEGKCGYLKDAFENEDLAGSLSWTLKCMGQHTEASS